MALIMQSKSIELQVKNRYQKQTYRNRTSIYGANGILNLIIPVKRNKDKEPLIDQKAEISFEEAWQKNHWKSIVIAYRSSPFFEFYSNELEAVFFTKPKFLVDFNTMLLKVLFDWLDIEKNITISSNLDYNNIADTLISAKKTSLINLPKYSQVFDTKSSFLPNLSTLDLVFNLGPDAIYYLSEIDFTPMKEL